MQAVISSVTEPAPRYCRQCRYYHGSDYKSNRLDIKCNKLYIMCRDRDAGYMAWPGCLLPTTTVFHVRGLGAERWITRSRHPKETGVTRRDGMAIEGTGKPFT